MLNPRRIAGAGRRAPAQALTEFAVVLPVILLIFLAALDVGRVMYAYVTINDAAQAGAAWAATDEATNPADTASGLAATIARVVKSESNGYLDAVAFTTDCASYAASDFAVCAGDSTQTIVNSGSGNAATVHFVTVAVKYTFTPITPVPFASLPLQVQVSAPSQAE